MSSIRKLRRAMIIETNIRLITITNKEKEEYGRNGICNNKI